MRELVAVSLAVSLAGCSLFMTKNRKGWKPAQKPTCDASRVLPIIDTTVAVGAVAAALGMLAFLPCEDNAACFMGKIFAAGIPVLGGSGYALGAGLGYSRARTCRKANREHAVWLARHEQREEQLRQRECELLLSDWRDEKDPKLKAVFRQRLERECPKTLRSVP